MKKAIIILGLIILSTGCGKKEEKTIPEENKPKIDYKIDIILKMIRQFIWYVWMK